MYKQIIGSLVLTILSKGALFAINSIVGKALIVFSFDC